MLIVNFHRIPCDPGHYEIISGLLTPLSTLTVVSSPPLLPAVAVECGCIHSRFDFVYKLKVGTRYAVRRTVLPPPAPAVPY